MNPFANGAAAPVSEIENPFGNGAAASVGEIEIPLGMRQLLG